MRVKVLFVTCLTIFSVSVIGQTVDFDFTEVCYGDTTLLTSTSVSETDPILYWQWDLDDDGQFDDASGAEVKFKFSQAGSFLIGLRILTESGFSSAKYQEIIVGNYPVAYFTYENACANTFTNFTNATQAGDEDIEDFYWDFGDGGSNNYETNPSHWYTSAGFYTVRLIAESSLGCRDTITRQVEINPIPTFNFQFVGDTIFDEGESLTVYAVGDFDNVLWSTGATTSSIVITEGGYYYAEVSNEGCPNLKSFTIIVNARVGISKVITPNSDGYNDYFEIYNIGNHSPCKVSIFSREGLLVYSSTNYDNHWDGTYNGKPLPEGTYYYIVNCNSDELKNKKGSISIIR